MKKILWTTWWRRRQNCLATKQAGAEMARNETGSDESGGDEVAAPKSPVPKPSCI